MTYYLFADLDFEYADEDPNGDTDEGFDEFTDAVADELYALAEADEGIIDPDVTVGIADRRVTVFMGVEADTLNDAARLFMANVRCALHAAGAGTPDWPVFRPSTPKPPVRQADLAGA